MVAPAQHHPRTEQANMKSLLTSLAVLVALGGIASEAEATHKRARPVTADDIRLVASWYQKYLGRDPDQGGLMGWACELARGGNVEAGILSSEEYYLRFGATPESFVFSLYVNVLSREPDFKEVQGWVCRWKQLGCNRGALACEFLRAAANEIALRAAPPPVIYQPVPPAYQPPPGGPIRYGP
jgi:hypothetical protein